MRGKIELRAVTSYSAFFVLLRKSFLSSAPSQPSYSTIKEYSSLPFLAFAQRIHQCHPAQLRYESAYVQTNRQYAHDVREQDGCNGELRHECLS